MPVSQANELFNTTFSVYNQTLTGKQFVRTLAYSIPPGLQGALYLVHPTLTYVGVTYAPVRRLTRGCDVDKLP